MSNRTFNFSTWYCSKYIQDFGNIYLQWHWPLNDYNIDQSKQVLCLILVGLGKMYLYLSFDVIFDKTWTHMFNRVFYQEYRLLKQSSSRFEQLCTLYQRDKLKSVWSNEHEQQLQFDYQDIMLNNLDTIVVNHW